MEFKQSIRGKLQLIYEQHTYRQISNKNGFKTFRCNEKACCGSLMIDDLNNIVSFKVHNHEPNTKKILRAKIREFLEMKINNTAEKSIDVITQATSKLNDDDVKKLSSYAYMRDKITKDKNKKKISFNPLQDDIPNLLRSTINGTTFFRHDSGINDENRFVVFYSDFSIPYITNLKIFGVDGTFKTCPREYFQLFTIHGLILGKFYPLVFCLLTNKTEISYVNLFNYLKKKLNIYPKNIISDFENSIFIAANSVFPNSKHNFCTFHFGQSIWRNLQRIGLQSHYNNDVHLKKIIRRILNLVYFPTNEILDVFRRLKEKILAENKNNKLVDFLIYFEKTYIGTYNVELNVKKNLCMLLKIGVVLIM